MPPGGWALPDPDTYRALAHRAAFRRAHDPTRHSCHPPRHCGKPPSPWARTPWRVFREVDLPILLRAIIVSLAFSFTISLGGEFGASSFLSSARTPTIPTLIFRYISQPGALNYGQALAMSTLLLVTSAAGSLLIENPFTR